MNDLRNNETNDFAHRSYRYHNNCSIVQIFQQKKKQNTDKNKDNKNKHHTAWK